MYHIIIHSVGSSVLAIGGVEPRGGTLFRHALVRDPQLKRGKGNVRMTVFAGILSCVDVGTEVSPNTPFVDDICGTVVGAPAVIVVTSGAFASILEAEVCVAGKAIYQHGTLELNFIVNSKLFVDQIIQYRFLDVTAVGRVVKPIRADVMAAAFAVRIFYSRKWD